MPLSGPPMLDGLDYVASLADLVLDLDSMGAARDLAYGPALYFVLSPKVETLALKNLLITHVRPTGVASAAKLMRRAALGVHPKRAPIRVRPTKPAGAWLVLDGNSTTVNAYASGWPDIPCEIASG